MQPHKIDNPQSLKELSIPNCTLVICSTSESFHHSMQLFWKGLTNVSLHHIYELPLHFSNEWNGATLIISAWQADKIISRLYHSWKRLKQVKEVIFIYRQGDEQSSQEHSLFTLPASKEQLHAFVAKKLSLTQASEHANDDPAHASHSILVVDDSPFQRQAWAGILREAGFDVREAEDGQHGLEQIMTAAPELVVTDVEMPRMNGYELCDAVRDMPVISSTPILLLTTKSDFKDIQEGYIHGASGYIVKPKPGEREAFKENLISQVENLLIEKQQQSQTQCLLIDENPLRAKMLAEQLQNEGYQTTSFAKTEDVFAYLQRDQQELTAYSVILISASLEKHSGLELAHVIRKTPMYAQTPIILMHGAKEIPLIKLGEWIGIDSFIQRPISEEKLNSALHNAITKRETKQQMQALSRLLGHDAMNAARKGAVKPKWENMTILFTDLVGFTKMCAQLPAADVVDLLSSYFDEMVPLIWSSKGYINKFIGDAMMVLFRNLKGEKPHPIRAIECATKMQQRMPYYNNAHQSTLSVRIGINTGEVIMGAVGTGDRLDYTVIGDHVNKAQRLEGQCPPGKILVSELSFQEAAPWINTQGLSYHCVGELSLKGLHETVNAFIINPPTEG